MDDVRQALFDLLKGIIDGEWGPYDDDHYWAMVDKELPKLGLTQVFAPVVVDDDGYTWPHWNEWYDDRRQAEKAVADDPGTVLGTGFITDWTA